MKISEILHKHNQYRVANNNLLGRNPKFVFGGKPKNLIIQE